MKFYLKFFIFQIFVFSSLFANFLDQKLPVIKEISKETYIDLPSREYEDIALDGQNFGNIKFSISYPKNITKDENVLLLIDGLDTGRDVLQYIPHLKDYVIIGYEYQKNLHRLRKKSVFFHLPSTRRAVLDVPFQLVSIVKWIEKQAWYSHKNVIIIGVSFGAIFVPATYQLAQINNLKLGPGIMAFGGAGIYDIFYANLKNYDLLRKPLAYFAYQLFKPIDPVFHLPYIHGKFLIINGTKDENIPLKSAQLFQELTPDPKTIINIDTTHLQPGRKDIIDKIVDISLEWLKKNQ
ncbi:MAG: hypothetical protein K1000chlam1_01076 [Candidatus Anoxychlamydiales bacterium]|nr:hypothetical protein [Candidatus Anoxychlamydiales bacterium]